LPERIIVRLALGSRLFAPSLPATLLLLPALAVLLWAGNWQLERAAETRARLAAFDTAGTAPAALTSGVPSPPRYARVSVSGHYRPEHQVLLDNMTHQGAVGYRVLTPFATDDGALLLVDRGWIALGTSRATLPAIAVDDAPRSLTGRLDALPRAGVSLPAVGSIGWPRVLNYPTQRELEAALGATLYPGLVLLDPDAAGGYVREWRPGDLPPERHLGYAVQWFALAVTLFIGYVVASLRPRPAQ
jgi:surfeit locus 1 family protein